MNILTTNPQQVNPRPITQLEYARMIAQAHGQDAPVTWLSVGDLVALLEQAEQPQAVQIPLLERVS